ncbi:DNA-binding protein, partial [Porphyromonas gingivalis]
KHLYFFEDELLAWIEGGKKKTVAEINEEAKTFISEKHSDSSLL